MCISFFVLRVPLSKLQNGHFYAVHIMSLSVIICNRCNAARIVPVTVARSCVKCQKYYVPSDMMWTKQWAQKPKMIKEFHILMASLNANM